MSTKPRSAARPAPASRAREVRQARSNGARSWLLLDLPHREQINRMEAEFIGKAQTDREHQQAEQETQLLARETRAGSCAELGADHAADHQDQCQYRVDQMVGGGMD